MHSAHWIPVPSLAVYSVQYHAAVGFRTLHAIGDMLRDMYCLMQSKSQTLVVVETTA